MTRTRKKNSFKNVAQRRIISGLLVIVPLGMTIYILKFLYQLTAGQVTPLLHPLNKHLPSFAVPAISVLFLVILTYSIGMAARFFIGKKLIDLLESLVTYIPMVKTVYSASKQMVQILSTQDENEQVKSIVLLDFPKYGSKTFGFITGKMNLIDKETGQSHPHYRLFVPTTPNPTSGYMEFIPVEEVEKSNISTEDAVKCVISAGLVLPDTMGPLPESVSELVLDDAGEERS